MKNLRKKTKGGQSFLHTVKKTIGFIGIVVGICMLFFALTYWVLLPQFFTFDSARTVVVTSRNPGQSDGVVLAYFAPQVQKTFVFIVDGSEQVEALGGYGAYSIQSLYSLLVLDKRDNHFIRGAFSHALGVPVDAVVAVEKLTTSDLESQNLTMLLQSQLFSSPTSLKERLELLTTARVFQTNETRLVKKTSLLQTITAYPLIDEATARACEVAVVNTTKIPNLASGISQLLELSGAVVVRITSTDQEQAHSLFITSDASTECQSVVSRAAQVFPNPPAVEVSQDATQRYRADVVIFIGSDLGEALSSGR